VHGASRRTSQPPPPPTHPHPLRCVFTAIPDQAALYGGPSPRQGPRSGQFFAPPLDLGVCKLHVGFRRKGALALRGRIAMQCRGRYVHITTSIQDAAGVVPRSRPRFGCMSRTALRPTKAAGQTKGQGAAIEVFKGHATKTKVLLPKRAETKDTESSWFV
jgi:hypothetical protein